MILANRPGLGAAAARPRMFSMAGLRGAPPDYPWPTLPYYISAKAEAVSKGYSVPMNAGAAGGGAAIQYVNPDGTIGRIFNWQQYPPQVYTGPAGTPMPNGGAGWTWDTSWIAPPRDVWFAYMATLGVADIAAIQAANLAAAQAYAANAGHNALPGVDPSTYGQGGSGSSTSNTSYQSSILKFTTSRGGTSFVVGDTWTVKITNSAANAAVSVYGVHPDGTTATAAMGSTDAQGNFSLSGTFTSDTIGTWSETWYVGGQGVGSFSFSVSNSAGNSGGSSAGGGSGGSGGSGSSTGGSCDSSSFSIGGFCIPLWALGAAALFLFMGGKR